LELAYDNIKLGPKVHFYSVFESFFVWFKLSAVWHPKRNLQQLHGSLS